MEIDRGDRKKRKKPKKDPGDIDDIMDRINRINHIRDLLDPNDENEFSWELEETDGAKMMDPEDLEPEILDMGDSLAVTLEIPRIRREEIELFMDKGSVSVRTKHGFKKDIGLPHEVIHKGSRATYKNGVLDMVLRKAK